MTELITIRGRDDGFGYRYRDADQPEDQRSPVTYFIQAESGGPIKIGRAGTPAGARSRRDALQTASPHRLVIRRVIAGDHELFFHSHFAAHRIRGEWFLATEALASFAYAITRDADDAAFATAVEATVEEKLENELLREQRWIGRELGRFLEKRYPETFAGVIDRDEERP